MGLVYGSVLFRWLRKPLSGFVTIVTLRQYIVTLCPCHEPLVARVAQNSGLPNNFGRVEYNTYLFKDVLNT